MFIKLSSHIFSALGLNTCLNEIWNLYIYQRDLSPFKCWSGFRSGAGQKTLEIFVYASSNEKWRHLRSKLGFLARFTKQENGISITQTISFVSFYSEDGKMFQAHFFDVLSEKRIV